MGLPNPIKAIQKMFSSKKPETVTVPSTYSSPTTQPSTPSCVEEVKPEVQAAKQLRAHKSVPQRSMPPYATKYSEFQKFTVQHRDHQWNAIKSCEGKTVGQISIPTGTGKSRVQEHLHLESMLALYDNNERGVFVIAAHRLALCKQLVDGLAEKAIKCGIPFDLIFVGSDRVDESAFYAKYRTQGVSKGTNYLTSTTKQDVIKEQVNAALNDERTPRNVIIVSTYHSFDRLAKLERIDMVTFDEAHTIASSRESDDNFYSNIKKIVDLGILRRKFFFTATRKVDGEEFGMNEEAFYGPLLCEYSPLDMVSAWEIVPPKLISLRPVAEGEYKNDTMLVNTIQKGMEVLRRAQRDGIPKAATLGAKMLVTVEGTDAVDFLKKSDEFRRWCLTNEIKLFLFASDPDTGCSMFDSKWEFQNVGRNAIMAEMIGLLPEQDAIMVHIDILTEGIDLPAITGIMTFRELNLIKLLQTVGRGARLVPTDRTALYTGMITPGAQEEMVKPFCWVLLPELDSVRKNNAKRMADILRSVYSTSDAPQMQFSREDSFSAIGVEPLLPITPRDGATAKDKESELIFVIEDLLIPPANGTPKFGAVAKAIAANVDPSLIL